MKLLVVVAALLATCASGAAQTRPWEMTIRTDGLNCRTVSFRPVQTHKDLGLSERNVVQERTTILPGPSSNRTVLRFLSYDTLALVSEGQAHCSNDISSVLPASEGEMQFVGTQSAFSTETSHSTGVYLSDIRVPPLEVIGLVNSGSSDNRIDLAFFGDGYTANEREKFLEDASRLVQDMSSNQTFFSVKPLMNFWAVFTPSQESGVGVGGKAKDTPFGLYRDGTELRALYANNSDVALAACASLGDKCNYAILLGNDPLYGGLGGEYTTTTPSFANGALVLRHELGHSIIEVGEEYDGGYSYYGVNAVHDPSYVTWSHWLTNAQYRIERSNMPMQAYPWTLLDVDEPWAHKFTSSGRYSRHLIKFSLSGIPVPEDLVVYLDGIDLRWEPKRDIGVDRWHYNILVNSGLSAGEHLIEFALRNGGIQGQAQLCSVEVLEYGTEEEFNVTKGYYSLFPTYDLDNQTSYRPTNDDCLMRSVTEPNFCRVCLEGLWLSLLKRVDLIDDLRTTCVLRADDEAAPASSMRTIELDLVPLAQFRQQPTMSKESYTIIWSRNGRVLEEFANLNKIEVDAAPSQYRVDVFFSTEEVRVDTQGYLRAGRTLDVRETCI